MRNSITRCWCNICGQPMETLHYELSRNYCSPTCERLAKNPEPKHSMEHVDQFVRKGRPPVALRMAMGMV